MNRFSDDDLILVTGASGGIGEETVKKLIKDGAKVIGIARNRNKLQEIKDSLVDSEKFDFEIMDLSENISEISDEIVKISEKYGKFSGFVHCAGVLNLMPVSVWDYNSAIKDFNINLFSAIEIIKALQKKKCKQELLNIVLVSSIAAFSPNPSALSYGVSKAALNALSTGLTREIGNKKIRINSICPGGIETSMSKNHLENSGTDYVAYVKSKTPFQEIGKTEYVSNFISFLLSKESYWIQGQNIVVDGGETL